MFRGLRLLDNLETFRGVTLVGLLVALAAHLIPPTRARFEALSGTWEQDVLRAFAPAETQRTWGDGLFLMNEVRLYKSGVGCTNKTRVNLV